MYEKILERMISYTADQWNQSMSSVYGQTTNKLISMFKTRDSSFVLDAYIPVSISRPEISRLAALELEFDNVSKDEPITEKNVLVSSIVEKYQIKFDKDDVIFDAISLVGKIIIGIDFSDSNLGESFFSDCIFYACKFNNSVMDKTKFSGCIFNTCEMSNSDLTNSVFSRCRLFDSIMTNTSFEYSTFNESILIGMDLSKSNFRSVKLINTSITESNVIFSDWSHSDIFTASLSISDFSGSDFTETSIVDCIIMSVNMVESNLKTISLNANSITDLQYDPIYDEVFNMDTYLYSPGIHEWEPFAEEDDSSTDLYGEIKSEIEDIDPTDFDGMFNDDDSDKPWLN
jgi:fluoroquinolone resistance protein